MESDEAALKGYTMERVIKFLELRFKEAEQKRSQIEKQRKDYHVV